VTGEAEAGSRPDRSQQLLYAAGVDLGDATAIAAHDVIAV
jgi:hypothetical protein